MNTSQFHYRPEIDGLRSVAVVPVILFHAGLSSFSGGYVGVDVFFVISGYLITSLILKDMEAGEFSLLSFYERRARRILPALFFVILCCLPFAWMWMIPRELLDFGKSVWAVMLFASNFLFWQEAGYFGPALEALPLIHTWSLAVEEQYYLLFPLLLMACWSVNKRSVPLLISLIALGSLAYSSYITSRTPDAAFYLLPARAWELFTGALCAIALRHKLFESGSVALHNLLAAMGLLCIAWAIFSFDALTVFPGVAALLPAAGTALVILFSSGTFIAAILSTSPLVGLGLISYSAYLWHQPIFAFFRLRFMDEPEGWLVIFLFLLTLALAYLSWRFVEQPFRQRKRWNRTQIFKMAAVSGCLLFAVGLSFDTQNGYPRRMGPEYLLQVTIENSPCLPSSVVFTPLEARCLYGDEQNVRIQLWGDSHANMLAAPLDSALSAREVGVVAATYSGCSPVYTLDRVGVDDYCQELALENMQWLAEHEEIEIVILAARWTLHVEGARFDNGEGGEESGGPFLLTTSATDRMGIESPARKAAVTEAIVDHILAIQALGKQVVLVYPVPEAGWEVPPLLERRALFGESTDSWLSTSAELFEQRNRRVIEAFNGLPDSPQLVRVRPHELFCDTAIAGRCALQDDQGSLYADDDHLNDRSAAMVVELMLGELNQSGQSDSIFSPR